MRGDVVFKPPSTRAIMVRRLAALELHVPAWRALARHACDANVYYEPEFLLPCLEELGAHLSVRVVLVFAKTRAGEETLIGLFPFCRARMHKLARLPELKGFSTQWLRHLLLGTPLIHAEHADAALDGFLDLIDRRPEGLGFAELREFGMDGAFWGHLARCLAERNQPHLQGTRGRTRALFRRCACAEEFLDAAIGRKGRRARLDQQRRQLERQGRLAYRRLEPGEDHEPWVRSFLELEVIRWAGHEDGKPLAADSQERRFFEKVARDLHGQGRLLMHGLALDGRMIAQNCTFLGADRTAAFVFRIAYDERYAKQSPGVQLELDIIRAYHHPGSRIMQVDSCAHTAHRLWNPLWPERRSLGHLVIGANRPSSRLLLTGVAAAQATAKATAHLQSMAGHLASRARGLARRPVPVMTTSTRSP
jgi:hypothetical protein